MLWQMEICHNVAARRDVMANLHINCDESIWKFVDEQLAPFVPAPVVRCRFATRLQSPAASALFRVESTCLLGTCSLARYFRSKRLFVVSRLTTAERTFLGPNVEVSLEPNRERKGVHFCLGQ